MKKILDGFLKSGFGSAAFLVFTAISQKIFSIYIGTTGMGLYSLMKQITQTGLQISTLNGSMALIQGASVREGEERHGYLATIFKIIFLASLVVSLGLILFAPLIGKLAVNTTDPRSILLIRLLSIPVLLGGLNAFFTGFLNVYRLIGKLAIIQTLSGLAAALVAYPVARIVESGNAIGFIGYISAPPLVGLIASIVFLIKQDLARSFMKSLYEGMAIANIRHFFSFSAVTFVTGLLQNLCLLLVRSQVVLLQGLSSAGYLEVAWSISMHYITLVLSSFTFYYMPTLTQTTNAEDKRKLIGDVLRLSIILATPIIAGVIIFKPLFIRLLYSEEFLPAVEIMRWMLVGDYLKITSTILGMTIFAACDLKSLLFIEVAWDFIFLIAASVILRLGGSPEAVGIAFVLGYVFMTAWQYYYDHIHKYFILDWRSALTWLSGFLLILISTLINWNRQDINIFLTLGNVALIPIFLAVSLSRKEWQQVIEWVRNPQELIQKMKLGKKQ